MPIDALRGASVLLMAVLLSLFLCSPALAQEEDLPPPTEGPPPEGLEYQTFHVGIKGGVWINAELEMTLTVGGAAAQAAGLTRIDVEDDLGVDTTETVPFGELFMQSRWVNLTISYFQVEYEGDTTLTRQITFGDFTFNLTDRIDSRLFFQTGDAKIQVNIVNNHVVMVGPIIGARLVHVEGEIKDETTFINEEEEQDFPLPELGLGLAIRIGPFVEISGQVTGFVANYQGIDGEYLEWDAGVTVYPIPNLGIRGEYRYLRVALRSDENETDDEVNVDFSIGGFAASAILRF